MSFLEQVRQLFEEAKEIRRKIHKNPEIGFELPKTTKIIKEVLDKYNIQYTNLKDTYAIIGSIGNKLGGKKILLRADMDAVQAKEESNLPFSSINSNAHLCGHDIHTTSLLITLIILKKYEKELNGQITFLFQPAEETLNGGKLMIEKGLLENNFDLGLALHMWPSGKKLGIIIQKEQVLSSALNFKIDIEGKGAHGGMPYKGVDPIIVASQIISAFNIMAAHELPSNKSASVSIGYLNTFGGSVNVIPSKVTLEGTARTLFVKSAQYIKKRLPEIANNIAKAFKAKISFEILADVPPLFNTPSISKLVFKSAKESLENKYDVKFAEPELASEDYAHIASCLKKSCYFFVSCPFPNENNEVFDVHNNNVIFNEEALIIGPTTMIQTIINFLDSKKK
ncbi:M20 metallopeptidase family protein [Metamycoplasma canadense]|uniref:Amidohydrolase n=1 Tax=Metamycoplasma canadense TaxID=29554 RepID=A0A077L921_9BACT|nr:M20 family metallopeptidase [Metamycoplasma canadense]BAP39498.1 amidohydrolase [Metamycoplasma canadense]